jgi:hypothetical protein
MLSGPHKPCPLSSLEMSRRTRWAQSSGGDQHATPAVPDHGHRPVPKVSYDV